MACKTCGSTRMLKVGAAKRDNQYSRFVVCLRCGVIHDYVALSREDLVKAKENSDGV